MAKIYGLFGSMTGKLADTVMCVRNGEQLARKYQPIVYNPNTPAQVAQRAKLKLLSQLSAVMAPAIAIPRQGSVSARNLFTKVNIPAVTYATDTATADLPTLQLTSSRVGINGIIATRGTSTIDVGIVNGGEVVVDRVVYVGFAKHADNTLSFLGSAVATTVGAGFDWGAQLPPYAGEVVIYAYGVRDNTDAARAKFGNYSALTGELVANLIVTRTLTESDVTLTKTTGLTLSPAA